MTRKSDVAPHPTSSSSPSQIPPSGLPTSAVWRVAQAESTPELDMLRYGRVRFVDGHALQFVGATANGLTWNSASEVSLGVAEISIIGRLTIHRAELTVRRVEGDRIETSALRQVEHVRTRSLLRVAAPKGLRIVVDDEEYAARDLSDRGVSFFAGKDRGFEIGASIPIAFNWHDRLRVLARFTVRHLTSGDAATAIIGGSLHFNDEDDIDRHREEIDALSYPFTRIGQTCSRDLWELFVDSGYFNLSNKNPEDFARFEPQFRKMSKVLARSRRLGVQITYPTSRGVDCSYGVIAEYPKTAMSIHTGRRSTGKDPRGISGREVLRDAYLRVIDWIRRCDADYMSVWVQDAAPPFIKGMLLNFVQSHVDGQLADIHRFHALEIACDRGRGASALEVRHAGHGETAEVYALFGATYPRLLAAARCWHDGADISSNWAEVGLTHERAVIVARTKDSITGAAICEAVPEGIHVYGLFDVVHIVCDPTDRETEFALLDAAARWYARLGKTRFIYAARSPNVLGAKNLGLTHGTLLSTQLFPELYEHIWDFMSPKQ